MTDFDERVRGDLALIGEGRSTEDLAWVLHTAPAKLRSFVSEPQSAPAGFLDTLAEICLLRHNAIAFADGPNSFVVTDESKHYLESSKLYAAEAARRIAAAWTVMRESVPKTITKRELRRRINVWLAGNPCEWRNPARTIEEIAGFCGKPVDEVLQDLGFTFDPSTS